MATLTALGLRQQAADAELSAEQDVASEHGFAFGQSHDALQLTAPLAAAFVREVHRLSRGLLTPQALELVLPPLALAVAMGHLDPFGALPLIQVRQDESGWFIERPRYGRVDLIAGVNAIKHEGDLIPVPAGKDVRVLIDGKWIQPDLKKSNIDLGMLTESDKRPQGKDDGGDDESKKDPPDEANGSPEPPDDKEVPLIEGSTEEQEDPDSPLHPALNALEQRIGKLLVDFELSFSERDRSDSAGGQAESVYKRLEEQLDEHLHPLFVSKRPRSGARVLLAHAYEPLVKSLWYQTQYARKRSAREKPVTYDITFAVIRVTAGTDRAYLQVTLHAGDRDGHLTFEVVPAFPARKATSDLRDWWAFVRKVTD